MTKAIYKYPFDVRVPKPILPPGAVIMHVGYQEPDPAQLMLWALVDVETIPITPRRLHVAGTGHPLPENLGRFLGSVQAGPFVWHVWDEPGAPT